MSQLTLRLQTSVNDDRPVYVVGNFNNWTVNEERFKMKRTDDHHYELTFPQDMTFPSPMEYKYIKGGWENEELDGFGLRISNRVLYNTSKAYFDTVDRWLYNGAYYKSAFLPKIEKVSDAFHIPQLDKHREVNILLPHDYHHSDKRYPVLYLQDGQNLYDESAPFGNWAIDKRMAALAEIGKGDLIIVAIDHGERERISEYTPIENLQLGIGKGEGGKYIDFMKDTLKPHIDAHYRTKTESTFTGVGGSSMGGLISTYAGLMYPDIFGKLMIFSPSLWIYPDIYQEIKEKFKLHRSDIYLYAGAKESKHMIGNINKLHEAIDYRTGMHNVLKLVVNQKGTHSESFWSKEFPKAVDWLFFN